MVSTTHIFCPKCRKELPEGSFVCEGCRRVLKRPKSINIAIVIELISGIWGVLFGFIFLFIDNIYKMITIPERSKEAFMVKHGLFVILETLILGIICFVVWVGLRRLRKWAGILGIIGCAISILIAISIPYFRDFITIFINILVIALLVSGWKSLS